MKYPKKSGHKTALFSCVKKRCNHLLFLRPHSRRHEIGISSLRDWDLVALRLGSQNDPSKAYVKEHIFNVLAKSHFLSFSPPKSLIFLPKNTFFYPFSA